MPAITQSLNSLRTHIANAQQQRTEAAMTSAACLDDTKFHGPLKALPTHLRVRDALTRAVSSLPTAAQAGYAAKVAGKFALYAMPVGFAGAALGMGNHYISRAPDCLFFDAPGGDPHAMAWAGLAAGLVGAGLLATDRYTEATSLAASVGGGTFGNVVGMYLGGAVGAAAGGAVSLPVNMSAWLCNSPLRIHTFMPVYRAVAPAAQALIALAAGGTAGYASYQALRPAGVEGGASQV